MPAPQNTPARETVALPRAVPMQRWRPVHPMFPPTFAQRQQILRAVRHYVAEYNPVPPLSLADLRSHAARVLAGFHGDPAYTDYASILVSNESWREQFAAVPYHRRLLLLPKCLRVEAKCPAAFDEFGLVCKQCGLCSIRDLTAEAEKLGYAVLVAEGTAIVMSLLQAGRIDAILGVSCHNVLQRAFPYVEAAAVPGIAIPLLQDDCADTNVDLDWVWDYIHLTAEDETRRLDLGQLREEVEGWFTSQTLEALLGPAEGDSEKFAREWLLRAGKRWRPFLAVAACHALHRPADATLPVDLQRLALAVECFHKASLIHDDIEDGDLVRYGKSTLHAAHGVPVALNVGDLLIGEGYRLLAECGVSPETRTAMVRVAAEGQRELCRGQGAELLWARRPAPLKPRHVIEIFRRKTAPAFEVALRLGALYAGRHQEFSEVLAAYSCALGIAYQIRDDLEDLGALAESDDIRGGRPSLLLAVAHERADGERRELLRQIWCREVVVDPVRIEGIYRELKADIRCHALLETYKEEAVRSLAALEDPSLKGLLRRVVGKIFHEIHIQGWCKEQEERNRAHPRASANPPTKPSSSPVAAPEER